MDRVKQGYHGRVMNGGQLPQWLVHEGILLICDGQVATGDDADHQKSIDALIDQLLTSVGFYIHDCYVSEIAPVDAAPLSYGGPDPEDDTLLAAVLIVSPSVDSETFYIEPEALVPVPFAKVTAENEPYGSVIFERSPHILAIGRQGAISYTWVVESGSPVGWADSEVNGLSDIAGLTGFYDDEVILEDPEDGEEIVAAAVWLGARGDPDGLVLYVNHSCLSALPIDVPPSQERESLFRCYLFEEVFEKIAPKDSPIEMLADVGSTWEDSPQADFIR
jgi:hypothetical protein